MTITVVQNLQSFFTAAIDRAMQRCKVHSSPHATAYLEQVLSQRTQGTHASVVLAFNEARSTPLPERASALRLVGDQALCTTGLLQDANHRLVLERVGPLAYREAVSLIDTAQSRVPTVGNQIEPQSVREALYEMSVNFVQYVLVVSELAVAATLGETTRDMVLLYEQWQRSKAPSALEAMTANGVFPSTEGGDA